MSESSLGLLLLCTVANAYLLIRYRFDLLHPTVAIGTLIGLYSYYSIYLAYYTGARALADFDMAVRETAYLVGGLSFFAFWIGSTVGDLVKIDKRYIYAPRPASGVLIGLMVLIGVAGGALSMEMMAGSISRFVQNLHMRQFWARGVSWTLFFLIPIKTAFFLLYHKKLVNEERSKKGSSWVGWISFYLLFVFVLIWLSLIAGRLFGLMLLIQFALLYLAFGRHKRIFGLWVVVLVVLIFLIYGLYRVGQAAADKGVADSAISYIGLALENIDIIINLFVSNFFDGWYVLLSFIKTVDEHEYCGCGLIVLSSVSKTIPGLTDAINEQFIPIYDWLSIEAALDYRAKSFIAESYADLREFGALYFFILGFLMKLGYRKYKSSILDSKEMGCSVFHWIYLYSILYVNALILVRSGIKVAYTWAFVEISWFVLIYLIMTYGKVFVLNRTSATRQYL